MDSILKEPEHFMMAKFAESSCKQAQISLFESLHAIALYLEDLWDQGQD